MFKATRILLIDDNDADNEFHAFILRKAGYVGDIVVFESAHLALDALNAEADIATPTLILLDINMPRMDGFEFVQAAADLLHKRKSVVIVMLTSSADGIDMQKVRQQPLIRDYIIKPLMVERARELLIQYFR